eukprot:scaffold11333_cov104-Isochrysis_galbana.AAC.2
MASTDDRHRQPSPTPASLPLPTRDASSSPLREANKPLSLTHPPPLGQRSSCSPEFSSSVRSATAPPGAISGVYTPGTNSSVSHPSARSGVGGSAGASGPTPRTDTLSTRGSNLRRAPPIWSPQNRAVSAAVLSSHGVTVTVLEVPSSTSRSTQWNAHPTTSTRTAAVRAAYASPPSDNRSASTIVSAVVSEEVSSAAATLRWTEAVPSAPTDARTAAPPAPSAQSSPADAMNRP